LLAAWQGETSNSLLQLVSRREVCLEDVMLNSNEVFIPVARCKAPQQHAKSTRQEALQTRSALRAILIHAVKLLKSLPRASSTSHPQHHIQTHHNDLTAAFLQNWQSCCCILTMVYHL
jgi:hypothetical protein